MLITLCLKLYTTNKIKKNGTWDYTSHCFILKCKQSVKTWYFVDNLETGWTDIYRSLIDDSK